jgi:hypothetical protein
MNDGWKPEPKQAVTSSSEDFSAVVSDPSPAPKKARGGSPKPESSNGSSAPPDLGKCTVPVLKDMLRERGLTVSGNKADLVERLS